MSFGTVLPNEQNAFFVGTYRPRLSVSNGYRKQTKTPHPSACGCHLLPLEKAFPPNVRLPFASPVQKITLPPMRRESRMLGFA